jgi:hypothetical protein
MATKLNTMPVTSEIIIEPFDNDRVSDETIAALHLWIRRWQEDQGQNKFEDLYGSQADLSDITSKYIEPGGNFFVARDTKDESIAGFVGLRRTAEAEGRIKRGCTSGLPKTRYRDSIGRFSC